jgi:hypothetical protein
MDRARSSGTVDHACSIRDLDLYLAACYRHMRDHAHSSGKVYYACSIRDLDLLNWAYQGKYTNSLIQEFQINTPGLKKRVLYAIATGH